MPGPARRFLLLGLFLLCAPVGLYMHCLSAEKEVGKIIMRQTFSESACQEALLGEVKSKTGEGKKPM